MRIAKYIFVVVVIVAAMAITATLALSSEREEAVSSVQYGVVEDVSVAMPALVPQPRSIELTNGVCRIDSGAKLTYSDERLRPVAEYLASHMCLEVSSGEGAVVLSLDDSMQSEEYRIVVGDGVSVVGGDYGGLFNGVTTLLQLLPEEVYGRVPSYPVELPCCKISDSPRWRYRGFMLDVCRTWIDKEAVMAFIDILAYHKINTLRLHLTDDEAWRIEIKSHPELAQQGGFRGGDSPIWPRYGKWNERWGGYYTQEDMLQIIDYAQQRNITIIPEIDLPGHSLCMATLHPEVLCDYVPNTSRAFGYDTRSALCPSREENYTLIADILGEVCELFPSEYIHIGGDEVDMAQWQRCPRCSALMREHNMGSTEALHHYFVSRVTDIVARYGKRVAVWNEATDGGPLADGTRVYGWEGVKESRRAAQQGYSTIVMPGQYFYFDMKQSPREPGHDWAAIFDWSKVYGFSPYGVGFTAEECENIYGLEASFFSELYASHNPESAEYLHYQTFPRMVAFAEIAWVDTDERDAESFYERMVAHYDRLDAMGVAYRLMPPKVEWVDGRLSASTTDGAKLYYRIDGEDIERVYDGAIATSKPALYSFISRRGRAFSPEAAVEAHFRTITPKFDISSSMPESERFTFDKAEGYGRIARTARAADVGDWVMFSFDAPVECRRMRVATGNFQLPRYTFENGYVEISYDGLHFKRVGDIECGGLVIEAPERGVKCVRITSTSRGNGAEWVSIQPPTIWPKL